MDETPFHNPFDEDDKSDGMTPIDDGESSRRTLIWVLLGIIAIGCGLVFAGALFWFKPDAQSIYDRYFPSATPTSTRTPTPTATSTSTPTITPTPTLNLTSTARAIHSTETASVYHTTATVAAGEWRVIMTEPFDSNENDWLIEENSDDEYALTSYEIIDGKYKWTSTAHQPVVSWVRIDDIRYSDFYACLEIQQMEGPSSADYGLILREDADSNFYYFGINEQKQYVFYLYYNDWTTLRDWTFTDLIRPGEVNRISVIAQGDSFTFFINDQFLFQISNDKIARGKVALAIELAEENDTGVFEFDNFELRVP